MPLESASFLSDLNSANPAHTDPQAQGDAHIRLIKATLKATFPSFTSAALNSTQAAIDAAVAAVTGGTVSVGAGSAATPSLSVNGQGGLYSPGAHQVGLATNGVSAVVVNSDQSVNMAAALAVLGNISSAALISGKGTLPVGVPLMWLTDTAPTGYLMANGQAVSRTTYAALFAVYGIAFGAGNGSTTFNLPNMQEVIPIGKSGMGGATSPGRVTHLTINTVGAVVGEEQHALVAAENAPHVHGVFLKDPGHQHTVGGSGQLGGNPSGSAWNNGTSNTSNNTTGITIWDTAALNVNQNQTGSQGSGSPHNVVQPSFVVNYIVYAGV